MNNKNTLIADNGFFFGLGVFETISIENNRPVFLEKHLLRMKAALESININNPDFATKVTTENIQKYLFKNPMQHGALKYRSASPTFYTPNEKIHTK
jgi:4-amino-4-deoxychorismate lyase